MGFIKRYWVILLLLFYSFSIYFKTDQAFEQDLGRHLKLGEMIVKTHQIPKVNLFSYTNPDFPFVNHHWLFQVLVYLGKQTIGLQGIMVLKMLILLLTVYLVLRSFTLHPSPLTLPVSYLFLHLLRERTDLRPEVFSFLFTALTIWILEKRRYLWLLPLIQLLWTNIHIYFPLGLMLQGIYLVDFFFKKQWREFKFHISLFLVSIISCLLNPSFIKGALYPFQVFGNYGYTIVENQTLFLLENIGFKDPNILPTKLAWGIAFLAVLTYLLKKKFSLKNLGLIGLGVGLSLTNIRSIPYLVFISLPAVISAFSLLPKKLNFYLSGVSFLTALLLITESLLYLNNYYYLHSQSSFRVGLSLPETGKKALDFVEENQLPGPIFNNFDIGSYISYRSYPRLKVFVDGRPEAYPREFFTDVYIPMQYDYTKFKDWDQRLNFQTIIFSHTDQTPWAKSFLLNISQDPNWSLAYLDPMFVIFVRSEAKQPSQINDQGFSDYLPYVYLAAYFINTNQPQKAQPYLLKASAIYPDNPFLNGSSVWW